jgi:hypothetical protein
MTMRNITINLANGVSISAPLTDEMLKSAVALTRDQISMLRACFEDEYGKDPATLSAVEIASMVTDKTHTAA